METCSVTIIERTAHELQTNLMSGNSLIWLKNLIDLDSYIIETVYQMYFSTAIVRFAKLIDNVQQLCKKIFLKKPN